jgi:transcriptional regulator with XRE-family HTH domain
MKITQSAVLNPTLAAEAKRLGAALARLRIARGMKQDQVALRAGLSRNTAYRLEKGDPGIAMAGRETFTLSSDAAGQSIAKIWRTVREWKVHFEEYEVPADQIQKIAPAFRHIDDVSTPALRKLIP